MWICRQLLLEEAAGATASSATAKGLHFPCSHLCSLENSDSGGGKRRFAVSKHTSVSLQVEPSRRKVMNWDQPLDGDMYM